MGRAITTIADLIEKLVFLKEVLKKTKNQFEKKGNYEKLLLAKEIEPTKVYILNLKNFFEEMRNVTMSIEEFDDKEFSTVSLKLLYADVRDTIYRAGKCEEGGVNQNPNGLKISTKKIYLGNPPGTWKKNIPFILQRWDDYAISKPDFVSGYSCEAYNYIKKFFVLIDKIDLLQKKLGEVST